MFPYLTDSAYNIIWGGWVLETPNWVPSVHDKWQTVTDLDQEKQRPAIALFLPENDEGSSVRDKVFSELGVDALGDRSVDTDTFARVHGNARTVHLSRESNGCNTVEHIS